MSSALWRQTPVAFPTPKLRGDWSSTGLTRSAKAQRPTGSGFCSTSLPIRWCSSSDGSRRRSPRRRDNRHPRHRRGDHQNEPLRLTLQIGALCNNSRLVQEEGKRGSQWTMRGDPTEGALVVAADKAGFHKPELEDEFPRLDEIPFSGQREFMATFPAGAGGGFPDDWTGRHR